MNSVERLLRPLADTPDDYSYEGGIVALTRHGAEHLLTIRQQAGIGVCVVPGSPSVTKDPLPLESFVQSTLLRLPVLAQQIVRTTQRNRAQAIQYIETPATFSTGGDSEAVPAIGATLLERFSEAIPGETRVYQLMASAGQGKTALLEHLAVRLANNYQPIAHPQPILLNVDLLGRYVGSLEDAIAGSLNNTYSFPSLTQRDVVHSIRNSWLILALDGFDELAARIGVRDAFLRLNELIEQLEGHGTLLLSARDSFFDLYQVSMALRTYVQPRKGSYVTESIRLKPWTATHGRQVFSLLGSKQPQGDLEALLAVFGSDIELALHPFFLPRLADLWLKGERFGAMLVADGTLDRITYVIDTFIARETGNKWIDRDGRPWMAADGHHRLLGVIAEEMWRSGAFRLDVEELRLAAESGLVDLELPKDIVEQILNRIPTHAALAVRNQLYGFLHDRFFFFFLGHRIAWLLGKGDLHGLAAILSCGELSPEVTSWVPVGLSRMAATAEGVSSLLNELANKKVDVVSQNVAAISAQVTRRHENPNNGLIVLKKMPFTGDALRASRFHRTVFDGCQFWNCDLNGAQFLECTFKDCDIQDIQVNSETAFVRSVFVEPRVTSVSDADTEMTFFHPSEIDQLLRSYGGMIQRASSGSAKIVRPRFEDGAIACVERLVRMSERATNVAVEELEAKCKDHAQYTIKAAIETGVIRTVDKATSGPRKHFVRFCVDRSKVLRAQNEKTGVPQIEAFWERMKTKFLCRD